MLATPDEPADRDDTTRLPWDDGPGGWGGHVHHRTPPGCDRPPILFVHGNGRSADDWTAHATDLLDAGVNGDAIWAITFEEPSPTHDEMAAELDAFVEKVRAHTGRSEIDVVAHSLGVTGVRWWMETRAAADAVRRFVAVAGANHGMMAATLAVRWGIDTAVSRPAPFLRHDYDRIDGHPLARLNEPPDVPPSVEAYTLRGMTDPLFPALPSSPRLDAAEENEVIAGGHDAAKDGFEARRRILSWLGVAERP